MEATHFIEVYKFDGQFMYDSGVFPIQSIENSISYTESIGAETIAVWRIKPTDVPLKTRMERRAELNMIKHGYIPERLYMEVKPPHFIKSYT